MAISLELTLLIAIVLVSTPEHKLTGAIVLAGYLLVSGLVFLRVPRTPIIQWYRDQDWLFAGTGPVDFLFKQIGARISIEAFALLVGVIAGGLGGVYWVLLQSIPKTD